MKPIPWITQTCDMCGGKGKLELLPGTPFANECDFCRGTGRQFNPVAGFLFILSMVVSTVLPIVIWLFWAR